MREVSIALCDDDRDMLELLAGSIRAAFVREGAAPDIQLFYSAQAFRARPAGPPFELLFLDIQMPGENGIALAESLRQEGLPTRVVFLSSREDKVFQALQARPYSFVRKSHFLEDLPRVVHDYLADTDAGRDADRIAVQQKGGILQFDRSEAVYIEGSGKNQLLHLHGRAEPVVIHSTMDALTAELEPRGFLRVHKGFLVNHRYIRAIRDGDVLLTTGASVPLSRRRGQEIKQQYLDALRREGTLLL